MLDFRGRHEQAARRAESVAAALAAPCDDHDTVTAAALRRLDHETVVRLDDALELAHLALIPDHAVEIGHGHPGFERQLLGFHLVVHARVEASRIEAHDELGVALVQPEHAAGAQFCRGADHEPPVSALKRPNSSRR